MLLKKARGGGFTLVEFLIALVINVILLLALISVFSSHVSYSNRATRSDQLNQQLQTLMNMMVRDIRRAGYWGSARNDIGTNLNTNPFMASATDLTISGSCILFTYDGDNNSALSGVTSSSDDERYGFRLNSQTLQSRPPGASYNCAAAANAWDNVTNPSVVLITGLTFTLTSRYVPAGATSQRLLIRGVTISITGRLAISSTQTKTLTQYVRLRNDKFVP